MLVIVMACACGCASSSWVKVRPVPSSPLADPLQLFSRGGPKPTERTMLLVRRQNLEKQVDGDCQQLLVNLREVFNREPSAEKLYSLSELAYLGGKKAERKDPRLALELHGAAVMHAYLYLFDPHFRQLRNPYDPEFRGACDLYNGALESALRIVQKQRGLRPGTTQTIEAASQTMDVTVVVRGNGWQADDFERFEFVSDYEINGLRNQYHNYGLGVPLIAVRAKRSSQSPVERFYPPGLSFPVTAFLRLLPDRNEADSHHTALLELYDPLTVDEIPVAGRRVPLESDLSTPLAYFLSQPALQKLDLATTGLLRPEETAKVKGLYMLEPYQPGKIPVLMVHGLWSSPITWMEMFNDLHSSPDIRSRYQFWFYLYPTGQPFWYSAAQLREDLVEMRRAADPQRREPALDQMVLVGHSMGGLISKMQTIESGNDYWNTVSDQPFTLVKASSEVRNNLERTFFFRANPTIRRVITIGTPHRGSQFANSTTRWLSQRLITLPKMLTDGRMQLKRDNPDVFRPSSLLDVPTSIDSLAPDSPIFPVILAAKRPPWLKYHNVVGNIKDGGFLGRMAGRSDGVVAYESAHLDPAEVNSEIEVEADHSTLHRHPQTVLEVRRILLEHLAELESFPTPVERLPWVASQPNAESARAISHQATE